MFKLEPEFDLAAFYGEERDEAPATVVSEHAPSPVEDYPPASLPQDLAIIGQEPHGCILVCRRSADNAKTCVDVVDMKSRTRTELYVHGSVVRVVGASVNREKTLLMFTTLKGSGSSQEYDSCMVEILPQGKRYSLGIKSKEMQHVKFLCDPTLSALPKRRLHLLNFTFILDNHFCHLYQISLRQKDGKRGYQIAQQPQLVAQIAKRLVWFEYDLQRGWLYVVIPSKEQTGAVLRCYEFPDRKPELLFECAIDVDKAPVLQQPAHHVTVPCLHSTCFSMSIVPMLGNAVCICQQTFVRGEPHRIDVTVWMLHHRARASCSIFLSSRTERAARNTSVVFDAVGHMLVIYIPGVYLNILDCGAAHAPCRGLFSTGATMATALPSTPTLSRGLLYDVPVRCRAFVPCGTDMEDGSYMLDMDSGIVYRYAFDHAALISLFSRPPPLPSTPLTFHRRHTNVLIAALHVAMLHLSDLSMGDEMVAEACRVQPDNVTPALIVELLIGAPHSRVKNNNSKEYLRCVPVTTSTPLVCGQRQPYLREDTYAVEYMPMVGLSQSSTLAALDQQRRFALQTTASTTDVTLADRPASPAREFIKSAERARMSPSSPSTSGMKRFFNKFFNAEGAVGSGPLSPRRAATATTAGAGATTPDRAPRRPPLNGPTDPSRVDVADEIRVALIDHVILHVPSAGVQKCADFAAEYQAAQAKQASRVYAHMVSCYSERADRPVLFKLLGQLHAATELIGVVLPPSFNLTFTSLGASLLPQPIFCQYVERGLFSITRHIFDQLMNGGEDMDKLGIEEDDEMRFFLLSMLVDEVADTVASPSLVDLTTSQGLSLVSDYFAGTLPIHPADARYKADKCRGREGNQFMPAEIYGETLRDKRRGEPHVDHIFHEMVFGAVYELPARRASSSGRASTMRTGASEDWDDDDDVSGIEVFEDCRPRVPTGESDGNAGEESERFVDCEDDDDDALT